MYADMICNYDVVNNHFYKTVKEIATWNVPSGAGSIEIHKWALQKICQELLYLKEKQEDGKI